MKTKTRNVMLVAMLVFLLTARFAEGATWTWINVDFPGAKSTEAQDIDGKCIVGAYSDGSNNHGFMYDGTNWTVLDYPGAIHTEAFDIDQGLIVGIYVNSSGQHGFIYDGTNWTSVDYTGGHNTAAVGVDAGNIVGEYTTNTRHGFLLNGTNWTTLDFPGAYQTELRDIEGSNIVGTYNFYRGCLYNVNDKTWTMLDFPGVSRTESYGIDGDGNIVGTYSNVHGFLYDGTTWTTLDFPGATITDLFGIDGGNIVGRYFDTSGKWHGCLCTLNESPVAICQDMLVAVDADGCADASVDGGSYDPDGDVIDFSQNPTGPYPVGVYNVELTVTDPYGASDNCQAMLVVYDPSGGFVTGGGWIWSPKGAYITDPWLEGKANFGFVSKYKKGASEPTGQTEFVFQAGDLYFHSSSYDWLVVAGAKAMFKGVGTINGAGYYGFMLSAVDAALTPSTSEDRFRIKIWDKYTGDTVVYDNQIGDDDNEDVTTAIGGGSIVIHKK